MLGDSFCKSLVPSSYVTVIFLSIPMLGDSFCKPMLNFENPVFWYRLSIPMLGDSFCKAIGDLNGVRNNNTFNPHAWGLFLQVYRLSAEGRRGGASFNPHAWGLFLQDV